MTIRGSSHLPLALAVALALAGCGGATGSAPAASEPAPTASGAPFDHTLFDGLLRARVHDGMVDYQTLKAEDRPVLQDYLAALAEADPEGFADRDDGLAFWLNAYNACVIAGVVERYPLASVMDADEFFEEPRWHIAGQMRSLNQIENEIIRPRFQDPRIHFILVCAAQSCPPLQARAMQAAALQEQLDGATRAALNDTRYVDIDAARRVLHLTRLMSWYRKDFEDEAGSLEAYLLQYLEEPAQSQVQAGGYSIEFMAYDWALNDAPATR